jgi:hypothetical protein
MESRIIKKSSERWLFGIADPHRMEKLIRGFGNVTAA